MSFKQIDQLLNKTTPIKWLFYGDSITHGSFHTLGHRDYTELFGERIRTEMERTRDVVIKTAISGNTTRDLLEDFEWRVAQFKPNVVFLMIGMNDCNEQKQISANEFQSNIEKLCDRIQNLSAIPVLQTTCPILPDTAPEREPLFPELMNVIRKVASARQLPLIDHTHFWFEKFPERKSLHFYWMNNSFHPNHYGHQVFAELIFKELGIFDPKAPSCRFFHP